MLRKQHLAPPVLLTVVSECIIFAQAFIQSNQQICKGFSDSWLQSALINGGPRWLDAVIHRLKMKTQCFVLLNYKEGSYISNQKLKWSAIFYQILFPNNDTVITESLQTSVLGEIFLLLLCFWWEWEMGILSHFTLAPNQADRLLLVNIVSLLKIFEIIILHCMLTGRTFSFQEL